MSNKVKNWFSILVLFLSGVSSIGAQSVYNNGSLISIKVNTIFSVPDSVVNNGEITNNGTLVISGTWINNDTYNSGIGELTLNSDQEQLVNHNDQTFARLNIEGGGQKLFEADITIDDELVLTDGTLVSVGDARIIFNEGATITGGSDDSYIEGQVVNRGTGNKLFPLGLNSTYLPLELVDVAGDNPEIGFQVFEPNPNSLVDGSLQAVSSKRYWQMEVNSGTFEGSRITLAIRNEDFLDDIANAVVAEAENTETSFSSLGQSAVTGDVVQGSVTSETEGIQNLYAIGLIVQQPTGEVQINVINAVSPNGDNMHDFLKIENITAFPDNIVHIFNRAGDKVFELSGYDNLGNIFEGISNIRGTTELLDGTYFYVIDKNDGSSAVSGFLVIRR